MVLVSSGAVGDAIVRRCAGALRLVLAVRTLGSDRVHGADGLDGGGAADYYAFTNMGLAVEICPHCSGEFAPRSHLTLDEVAVISRVSRSTVNKWVKSGDLIVHIWAKRGAQIVRVVFSEEFLAFRLKKWPKVADLAPGTLQHKLWTRQQRIWSKAGKASVAARQARKLEQQAKLAAQSAANQAQSSANSDPSDPIRERK
jgi:helix-turn-helix protein